MKTIHKAKTAIDKKIFDKRTSVYDIDINLIDNKSLKIKDLKGKYLMFVNVASNCGFTKQYEELQHLYEEYKDNLVIVGSPCNQFGGQEPGQSEEIQQFCDDNYGVTFLLTEKIDVKGNNQHPLYKWLTTKDLNGKKRSNVKWNFQKYLLDRDGNLIDYFYSITKPMSTKITKYLR
jgi:glutathione peroxidase